MTQHFQRIPTTGINRIERSTERYMFVQMSTTESEKTQEDQIDLGGGNLEPDTMRTFELNFSDFPLGRAVRAVTVDLDIGQVENAHLSATNILLRQTGGVDDYDKEFPWYVKKKTGGTWTTCGFLRAAELSVPPLSARGGQTYRTGHLDVKSEVDAPTIYNFRLGSLADSSGWRAAQDFLYIEQFKFVVKVEFV